MKDEKKFIADIVIPHYDRDDLLERCLKRIPKEKFNVIVESNGTFAQNCNRGAKRAKTENLIFLNDDVLITLKVLDKILNLKADIIGVAQKIPNIEGIIYGLGVKLSDEKDGTERFFAKKTSEVFFPSGFFFKINKKSWELLGGFNEKFKNGCEDSDLFFRAIEMGMSFDYIKDGVVHLHSQSGGRTDNDDKNSILLDKLWNRNRINNLVKSNLYIFTENNILFWLSRDDIYKKVFIAENKCPYCGEGSVSNEHKKKCFDKAPLISVIIPSRVGEDVLSLETLKKQTYKKIEIIVEYDEKKEGASVVRNRGARKSKGKYLFFCDNDLILTPNCLADLYLTLKNSEDAKWAFGKFYIDGILFNENRSLVVPENKYSVEWINYFCCISTMSLIDIDANPIFDESMKRYNDWDLWLSLNRNGQEAVFCDKVLFYTDIKSHSISGRGLDDGRKWKNKLYAKYEIDVESKIEELSSMINIDNLRIQDLKNRLKIQKDELKLLKASKFWAIRNLYLETKHYLILIFLNPKKFLKRVINRIADLSKKYKKNLIAEIFKYASEHNDLDIDISNKKVSVVMLTMNRLDDTKKSIEALFENMPIQFEFIILDNGSDIEMRRYLKDISQEYSNIKVIFEKNNIGCAGGRKKLFNLASGDYIFSIDNDIIITKFTIENLIKTLEANSSLAGACCKVVFPDGIIQYNGGNMSIDGKFIKFGFWNQGKYFYDKESSVQRECDWIPGGATIWRKDILRETEIDSEMRGAYEDNDYCMMIKAKNYKVSNCPRAMVIHNHIDYKFRKKSEKKYIKNRYDMDYIEKALVRFYIKHDLIIVDDYLTKIGLDMDDKEEILDYFNNKKDESKS